uniref:NADH dehydrogenase subunit 2 n=1 Tax=Hericium erinaceus TaxID=91752 RepID=UPI0021ACD968|nr:NADH dehydrogenase subunit 2 [Hericium erinaceus]YP_010759078.1 NADH dehydrogenase subunit 2 [Hericium alpestre]UUF93974.1 NADH dehydrogenase subunit 2 [Hericium erinaceus]WEX31992.1 NADH dehydrogenase subunit 2 [Hericium alpestre]
MIFMSILILIVAIALPLINRNLTSILYARITSILFIYAGALAFNAFYIQSIGSGIGVYSGLFQITQISQLFDTFICLIGSLIIVSWPLLININTSINLGNNRYEVNINNMISNYPTKYSLIVLMSTLGATLLISSSDLISLYLSIELQSFGVYILSSLYRNSKTAISAGLKYFLIGGLASCIILLGCGIIYTFTGLTQLESIYSIVSVSNNLSITLGLSLGLILLFIGFLLKIAAAPLHNWAPDVYDNSPTIVTIWLTIMPKISILILLLEIHSQIGIVENTNILLLNNITTIINTVSENTSYLLTNLLLIISLFSLLLGTLVGLSQTKIKRLLAYSTISHIGFILLALAINTEQSIESFLFYIIQYSITNLNAFLIIIAFGLIIHNTITGKLKNIQIEKVTGSEYDINYISELKGQFFTNPLLSLSLAICLFSMAGIPPLIGFFSKQFVLYSALQNGYYFMSIVAIIVSVISASYYLKIIKVLHSEEESSSITIKSINSEEEENTLINSYHSFLISSLTLFILLFILKPTIILNSTTLLTLSLFNY